MGADVFDYAGPFERALLDLGVDAEVVRMPYFRVTALTGAPLREIKALVADNPDGRTVIFCPGLPELFLDGSHHQVMFSAYRMWFDPARMRVMPHVWTNVSPAPERRDRLVWTEKPPPRIGFMGTAYANSRAASLLARLPLSVRRWLLSGAYLRRSGWIARLYEFGVPIKFVTTFPRFESLEVLRAKRGEFAHLEVEIVDTGGFTGLDEHKHRYADHLEKMTYVLCPRGSENFSFRVYEALKFGRVPVIVDTDMVLPPEIDWDRVAVRVPYGDLARIYDIVDADHRSRSAADFIERQRLALATMRELETTEWIGRMFDDILAREAR